ncbi:MAG: ComEC/Rec2 family competence protein [Sphingobium sp.]|nr:ComEC/Rec2 family competence protein [Sphingobium sp.]
MPLLRRSNLSLAGLGAAIEAALERERAQLPLWAPVALGAGICAWFALPAQAQWLAWVLACLGLALGFGIAARGGRFGQMLAVGAVLMAAGCLLPWAKAVLVGSPPLARAAIVQMQADVQAVEPQAARGVTRMLLAPVARADLPLQVRVNAPPEDLPKGLAPGDRIALRARLMPPPAAALPGAYDYAVRAYFDGIGATGRSLGKIAVVSHGGQGPGLRERLGAHVRERLPGPEGAIAVAFANGDQAGISEEDADAMRRAGLAHLLSISGLHVSALIAGVMFLVYRLLALSPTLALRLPLILIAACAGAAAGVGYTLLTGAQVPTVRSCVAALLVIAGLMLGREAISLRLVATGALVVLLFWPEAVIGPSFQMSFAAVTSIVALYEWPPARAFFARREEGMVRRLLRHLAALMVTGVAVELVLMPIALFHFHRAGLLGSLANLVAIPLTSFVVMPAEALALALDTVGLGAPAWYVTGVALRFLLGLAHWVSALPYAVMAMPASGSGAFVLTMLGLIWLMLWRGPWRLAGGAAVLLGVILIVLTPAADILVTADGRHVAVRTQEGGYALLRARAGDYVRDQLAESAGFEGEFADLATLPGALCSPDVCTVDVASGEGERPIRLLATRSGYRLPWEDFVAACKQADIVIADRFLPLGCTPRWLKLDSKMLVPMGGALVLVERRQVIAGKDPRDRHPWVIRRGR